MTRDEVSEMLREVAWLLALAGLVFVAVATGAISALYALTGRLW